MTDITPTPLPAGAITEPVSTTIDAALVTSGVRVLNADPSRLIIRVTNTTAGPLGLDIMEGDNPPSLGSRLTNFSVPGSSAPRFIGPLDSGQHMRSDGTIGILFENGFLGEIEIYEVARNA